MHSLLLKLPPELAHNLSMQAMRSSLVRQQIQSRFANLDIYKREVNIAGLIFANPIGLAAGLDKNAEAIDSLSHMGFSHLELGTVTPRPQLGSAKPRLFRLTERASLLNRMGFNNSGKDIFLQNIRSAKARQDVKIGVNIGKNKDTPNEQAIEDYKELYDFFRHECDYICVNVSSPNTQGLRALQNLDFLQTISDLVGPDSRVFLKLAPDMPTEIFIDLLKACDSWNFKALTLTNTLNVEAQPDIEKKYGSGGLSGSLLRMASREALVRARQYSKLPIISVGGIDSSEEVLWRLEHGASMAQLYTAFVYGGPNLINNILQEL